MPGSDAQTKVHFHMRDPVCARVCVCFVTVYTAGFMASPTSQEDDPLKLFDVYF